MHSFSLFYSVQERLARDDDFFSLSVQFPLICLSALQVRWSFRLKVEQGVSCKVEPEKK